MTLPVEFAHLKIPLEEIVKATKSFANENLIGQGGFGKVYKGTLSRSGESIHIVARRLHHDYGQGDIEGLLCYDSRQKKSTGQSHEHEQSLPQVAVTPKDYNHYIKERVNDPQSHPHTSQSQPPLSDGQPSSFTNVRPSSFGQPSSSNMVQPSSLGKEQPSGSTNILPMEANSSPKEQRFTLHPFFTMKRLEQYLHSPTEELLAQSVKSLYEQGKLGDMIDPDLWKQMNPQSFNIFSETAYSCLKEQRSQRPNMDQVAIKLQKAWELQRKYESYGHLKVGTQDEGTSSNHLKGKNLGHLEIPLIDINLATQNFADTYVIGSGAYGKVYKAELDLPIQVEDIREFSYKRKRTVAIKRILIREDKQGKQGFIAEIDLLTNCKHPNIVSLLGFCHEGSHMILVYEFASNGSLGDYLGSTDNLIYLTWAQRIKICIDIARGLHYLHTRVEDERRIIHRDIKSDNILLCKNWEAKIADFGLSRFHPENEADTIYTNNIAGTEVYLDPEYQTTETQVECPIAEVIMKELEKSLSFQESHKDNLHISLEDIKMATQNFSPEKVIGKGGFGKVYEGQLTHPNGCESIVAKRLDKNLGQGEHEYLMELEILFEYKQENIIGLVGYCNEKKERIIVYEHAPKGSLDKHLGNLDVTWMKRLKICIDVATGLAFLHGGALTKEMVIHKIAPESLSTFRMIVSQCLDDDRKKRPTAEEVLRQLNIALEFQEDYEIWEPKLPKDYKEIILMSKSQDIHQAQRKRDVCNMFYKGILLQEDKLWFSLGSNGKRNEMISASKFSYIKRTPHEWQSIPESRFKKVAKILKNFVTQAKIFKEKPIYVNLKYTKDSEILHAYFAILRDEDWMMIELFRFLNHKKDSKFKFIIESLSTNYCGDGAVYVEGIEFRAIHNASLDIFFVNHEQIEEKKAVQEVQHFQTNYDEDEKLFSLDEVNGKHLMLPAKVALHDSSNVKLFTSKPSASSRFQEVFELLPQQVFRINCTIKSHMLSPDTEYVCYLVFKLSEQFDGLHCPVKVRDLLQRKTEEAGIIYLIPPSPWNIHDFIKIPRQRGDGLMEVEVWKFNSTHDLKNNCLPMNLRMTSYEGTMSGLIVCGLEFRPIYKFFTIIRLGSVMEWDTSKEIVIAIFDGSTPQV
ncbi:kinase-like domain, phloem protein 2-like protein [Tanacetum coccineum]